jgi:3-phosphoshikimate 1-carboxyvinyltransferase
LLETIELDADISSQFISGLMLAASARPGVLNLKFRQTPVSFTYLKLTEHILNECDIYSVLTEKNCRVEGGEHLRLKPHVYVESEMAAGVFLMALGVFSEQGVGFQDTQTEHFQPDWEMIAILKDMGAIHITLDRVCGFSQASLHGITINLENNPDLMPLVSVLALFAESPTTLQGISRLKYKESDRLQGIITAFCQIGANYISGDGTLVIFPYDREPEPVVLDTQNDHRLVIAFTLLALHYQQLTLSETDSVAKSYPGFFQMLDSLKEV